MINESTFNCLLHDAGASPSASSAAATFRILVSVSPRSCTAGSSWCELPGTRGGRTASRSLSAPTTCWSASDEFRPNPPVPTTPVVDYVLASRNAGPGTVWIC
jgi:hypothetical protein